MPDHVRELQRLNKKFNVPNAAGTEFHVAVVLPFSFHVLVNLHAERTNRVSDGLIRPFFLTDDKRSHFSEKRLTQSPLPRNGPRFEQRQALPGSPPRLIVLHGFMD